MTQRDMHGWLDNFFIDEEIWQMSDDQLLEFVESVHLTISILKARRHLAQQRKKAIPSN
jgi:hypothetical protein